MRTTQDTSDDAEMPYSSIGCDCFFQSCMHCLCLNTAHDCRIHLEAQGLRKRCGSSECNDSLCRTVDVSSQADTKDLPKIDFDGVMGSLPSPPTPHEERSPTMLRFVRNLEWTTELSIVAADQFPSLEPIDTLRVSEVLGPMGLPKTPEKERQGTKLMISADNCYRTLVEDSNNYSSVSEVAPKEGIDPYGTFTVATPDIPMGEIQERLSRSATAG